MSGSHLPDHEFHTWQEIAAYLGISVREAQNRERMEGLPVRRLPGKKPRVWALQSELDAWKSASSTMRTATTSVETPTERRPLSWRNRWIWISGVVLLLGIALGFRWLHRGSVGLLRGEVSGNTLTAYDATGHALWTHTFPQALMTQADLRGHGMIGRTVQVGRFGRDQRILFLAHFANPTPPPDVGYDELYCFSAQGQTLWTWRPTLSVRGVDQQYDGPWQIRDFVIGGDPNSPRIWLALAHWMYRPGALIEMNSDGQAKLKFVNAGHLYALREMVLAGNRYIVAGGVNNEYSSAAVAIVREDAALSCSPQTPGSKYDCLDVKTVNPERYFLFPPTDINAADGRSYNAVWLLPEIAGRYTIAAIEDGSGLASAIYDLSSAFEVGSVVLDDGWGAAHRRLEDAGMLKHPISDCPSAKAPLQVRRWTPKEGFRTITVPHKLGIGPG